uniref:RCC1 domain-containing protein n=1 Tax=Facilibium subflavum TaxID=2219058 RepID=UPI001AAC9456
GDVIIKADAFDQDGKALGTRDLKVLSVDTSAQVGVQAATLSNMDIQLRPAVAVKLMLDHKQALNNAYLDFSQMPSELYDQLMQIQVIAQNKSIDLSQADIQQYKNTQIVPLDYLASPSTGTQVYLKFSLTSGAILNNYKATLEDSNTPPVQIGAANSKKIAPVVTVYDSVIDRQQIYVDEPSIQTIIFTNDSEYPINITRLITDNLPSGVMLESAGTCTPDSVIAINGNCEAQIEVQQNAQGKGELLLEYRIEEQAQDQWLQQARALSETAVTFIATTDVSAQPVGAKLEVANSLQIPLPQTPQGSVNKYLVNITNLDKLNLNAIDGMNIGQGVQLFDKEGNPYTNADIRLVADDSLITQNCIKQSLLANSTCQMVVEVDKEALPIDGLKLRFNVNRFKNLDVNHTNTSAADFNVVNQDGHLSFLNSDNELISNFEEVTTPASNFEFSILNDGGSAVTFTQLPSYSSSDLDLTTNCSLEEPLIPQQKCRVLVSPKKTTHGTLSFTYNNEQMLTTNIGLSFTISPYKRILSSTSGATCALTYNGELYCFGNNYQKQIFSSPSGYILTPVKLNFNDTLLEGKNIIDFIAGNALCAMTDESANNVYCWGGTRSVPEAMPIHVKRFNTANNTFCALTNDSDIVCWGKNDDGQAGDTALSIGWDVKTPTKIAAPSGIKFYEVSVGSSASCGITLDQKNIYCWGQNDSAQLGSGNTSFKNGGYKPRLVDLSNVNLNDDKITQLKISRFTDQICILTERGGIYCWGDNSFGSLGNDEIASRYSKPITVSKKGNLNNLIWTDLVAAGFRGFCALSQQNAVYCWGQNGSSTRMINPYTSTDNLRIPTPLFVQGTAPYDNQGKLSLGMNASSPCLITEIGNGYCWSSRIVGDGKLQNSDPVPVTKVLLP